MVRGRTMSDENNNSNNKNNPNENNNTNNKNNPNDKNNTNNNDTNTENNWNTTTIINNYQDTLSLCILYPLINMAISVLLSHLNTYTQIDIDV